jgi:hypothetical protein
MMMGEAEALGWVMLVMGYAALAWSVALASRRD